MLISINCNRHLHTKKILKAGMTQYTQYQYEELPQSKKLYNFILWMFYSTKFEITQTLLLSIIISHGYTERCNAYHLSLL